MSTRSSTCYIIRVQGKLDAYWEEWFEGMHISLTEDCEPFLEGNKDRNLSERKIRWKQNLENNC